jgi:PAS domain S-box-containing protein
MQLWPSDDRCLPKHGEQARLYALQALALRLNRSFDQRTIMEQATEWVAGLGLGVAILRLRPGDDACQIETSGGLSPQTCAVLQALPATPHADTLPGYVVRHQHAILIEDIEHEERFAELRDLAQPDGFRAILALPLIVGAHTAVLVIFDASAHDLDPATVRILELLASQLTLALENADVVAELYRRTAQLEQRHNQLRRAYDLVADERRMLAAVLDSAGDAVLVTDAHGSVLLGNQALAQVLGQHPDRLIGRLLRQTEVPGSLVALMQQARAAAEPHAGEIAFPDGRVFHVNIAPVQLFDQPAHAYVALFEDVTYFKRLDALKSQFVTTVSHDMKSPLNVITSYTELLELAGPLNHEQADYANRIIASVRRLSALVSDLLDLARIEGHVGLRLVPCDINALMWTTVDDHRLLADEKRIDLLIRPTQALPLVWGDESRLRQVFGNLLSNALAYTPRDGAIWLAAEADEQGITVRIEDSGVGIDPYDVPHIFDPFYRGHLTQDANSKGTGLGLAIVKRIVEEHGGAIGVESAINGGSTFWFTLPSTHAEA